MVPPLRPHLARHRSAPVHGVAHRPGAVRARALREADRVSAILGSKTIVRRYGIVTSAATPNSPLRLPVVLKIGEAPRVHEMSLRQRHYARNARASGLRPTVLRRKKQDVLKKREIRRDAPIA